MNTYKDNSVDYYELECNSAEIAVIVDALNLALASYHRIRCKAFLNDNTKTVEYCSKQIETLVPIINSMEDLLKD